MSGVGDAEPSGLPGAIQALAELGRAITATSRALLAIPGDDAATAFRCARPLDTALADLASLLVTVPKITGLGAPAQKVRERLDQSRADLTAKRADVASYRVTLDQFAQTEEELAEVSAEARELSDRITTLERQKKMVAEIPGLRAMVRTLEADIAALDAADAPEVSDRLATAVERLTSLTAHQRAVMSDKAADMVARAETAASELAGLRARADTAAADVARHESDAAALMAEHGDTLSMLAAWAKADLDLAEGMRKAFPTTGQTAESTLDRVRTELGAITHRLTELDDILGPLLAAHSRAYEQARQARSSS
jgi:chromosome segregation ATPase